MKLSMGAAVRLHRIAGRDRSNLLSAFKWNACPPSPESALEISLRYSTAPVRPLSATAIEIRSL
jgi:hypothetical protein